MQTNSDLQKYTQLTTLFGDIWCATGWKVSTWVHWTVRHSSALANLHRNFYVFSSIPTERRNVEFKLDVTHAYKGPGHFGMHDYIYYYDYTTHYITTSPRTHVVITPLSNVA